VQSSAEATTNTAPAPCGVIPSSAQAYSFNLTVVPTAGGAVSYVSIWPSGSPPPFVSTLNDRQGMIVANAAIVPAGVPQGGVSVYNAGPAATDVIIDMNGYFAVPTDLNGNTAIGIGTLANTTGDQNTAVGAGTLGGNTTGAYNTAIGSSALQSNTTGYNNTATGFEALIGNTTGGDNTATGYQALAFNTDGSQSSAFGFQALEFNTGGGQSSAFGYRALQGNSTGNNNTAIGYQALYLNTTGGGDTAVGSSALQSNTTGYNNTASGYQALLSNTTGYQNTASGFGALQANTTGAYNTASGFNALGFNTAGGGNTAIGNGALYSNTTGMNNIAIGVAAAFNSVTGNNNIVIGYGGGSDPQPIGNNSIYIGEGQTTTLIAGISGASVAGGTAVYVNSSGQLGTVLSSRRFKEQITDMGDSSSKLLQLRPVNFFYKPQYDDGSHLLQYGLIAEEVAKVYPEMVVYDKDGQPLTVKYQYLAPMLLNEVQKQNAQLQNQVKLQQEENRKLENRLAVLEALLSGQTPTAARAAGSQ
jgi:hypothetical protein